MGASSKSSFILYGITFILAACSLLYEFLMAQTILFFTNNDVIWYSLTIAVYLFSMGAGALVCSQLFNRGRNLWEKLFFVELSLSFLGGYCVFIIQYICVYFSARLIETQNLLIFLILVFTIIAVVGFLTGLELPLLIRLGNEIARKNVANRVLGIDYFGALAAGLFFPLVIVPHVELLAAGFSIALCNLAVASLLLIFFSSGIKKKIVLIFPCFACAFLFGGGLYFHKNLQQHLLDRHYYYGISDRWQDIFNKTKTLSRIQRYHSAYQEIDIVPEVIHPVARILMDAYSTKIKQDPAYPLGYNFYLNGDFQFSTNIDEYYHEYLAHIPFMLQEGVPQNILILGGGDGLLLKELLKYPEVKTVHLVEIDEKIINLVKHHPILKHLTSGAFEDPRVEVTVADAFHYIRKTTQLYDAIYMDFPVATDYTLSKLYSREFFHFVRTHLTENGFAAFDATLIDQYLRKKESGKWEVLSRNPWSVYYNTAIASGFKTVIPYGINLEYDNEKAIEVLGKQILGDYSFISGGCDVRLSSCPNDQGRYEALQKVVEMNIGNLKEGFIFLSPKDLSGPFEFKNFGIPLHALNANRFDRAFYLLPILPREINLQKVNSIMRPTLPNGLVIKFPLAEQMGEKQ